MNLILQLNLKFGLLRFLSTFVNKKLYAFVAPEPDIQANFYGQIEVEISKILSYAVILQNDSFILGNILRLH